METLILYGQLFGQFFKTGLFAVGGGLATLPFLQEMSRLTHWFTMYLEMRSSEVAGTYRKSVPANAILMKSRSEPSTVMRSMTQGRGSFTFRFVRYEDAPPAVQEKAIEAAKAMQEEAD